MTRRLRWVLIMGLILPLAACAGSRAATRGGNGIAGANPYEFHRAVAHTLLETDQPRQAIPHIRELQKLQPRKAEPFYLMARAYIQMGVPESAHEMLQRALSIDPELAGAQAALGVLLDGEGEHRRAELAHRRAVELSPRSAVYRNNLGFCLYLQKRYREAVAVYERALELDAGDRRTHNNLGFAYGRLGAFDDAYSHFRLAGTPAQAENNMGIALELAGQREAARERFRAAIQADPQLEVARDNLARVAAATGKVDQGGQP